MKPQSNPMDGNTTMSSSNKIYDKQNKDWQKPSPSVPPMPRGK